MGVWVDRYVTYVGWVYGWVMCMWMGDVGVYAEG